MSGVTDEDSAWLVSSNTSDHGTSRSNSLGVGNEMRPFGLGLAEWRGFQLGWVERDGLQRADVIRSGACRENGRRGRRGRQLVLCSCPVCMAANEEGRCSRVSRVADRAFLPLESDGTCFPEVSVGPLHVILAPG